MAFEPTVVLRWLIWRTCCFPPRYSVPLWPRYYFPGPFLPLPYLLPNRDGVDKKELTHENLSFEQITALFTWTQFRQFSMFSWMHLDTRISELRIPGKLSVILPVQTRNGRSNSLWSSSLCGHLTLQKAPSLMWHAGFWCRRENKGLVVPRL